MGVEGMVRIREPRGGGHMLPAENRQIQCMCRLHGRSIPLAAPNAVSWRILWRSSGPAIFNVRGSGCRTRSPRAFREVPWLRTAAAPRTRFSGRVGDSGFVVRHQASRRIRSSVTSTGCAQAAGIHDLAIRDRGSNGQAVKTSCVKNRL